MYGDSEAMSDRTSLVHMGLDDNLSSPRLESILEGSLVFDRESMSDPPSEEASPSGRRTRETVLLDDWSIHDFPIDISYKVFSNLRPCFQILDDVPIRKGNIGEKCYNGRSPDVGFYETAFIARLRLPLSSLHRQLASYMGISVSQIAPNAWRIFIEAEVLLGQLSRGHWSLTLEEFYYYKSQEIPRSKDFYNFACR